MLGDSTSVVLVIMLMKLQLHLKPVSTGTQACSRHLWHQECLKEVKLLWGLEATSLVYCSTLH